MLITNRFRTKRLTIPLVVISLIVSVLSIVLFQGVIFRQVFELTRKTLDGSFNFISRRIISEWDNRKYHFDGFLTDPDISSTIFNYLDSRSHAYPDGLIIESDAQELRNELINHLPRDTDLDFYLLNTVGTIVLTTNENASGREFSSLNSRFRDPVLRTLDQIRNNSPVELPPIMLVPGEDEHMNSIYLNLITNPQNGNITGLLIISFVDEFVQDIFSSEIFTQEKGEVYLIDKSGSFISPTKNIRILIQSLGLIDDKRRMEDRPPPPMGSSDDGMRSELRHLFVNNPGKKISGKAMSLSEYKEKPFTMIVEKLIEQPIEPIIIEEPYRNYLGEYVIGFGIWLDSVQMGIIYEATFSELLSSWFWMQGLAVFLILGFVLFFLLLAVYIDKHRIYALDSNPLSHLPGNRSINDTLRKLIKSKLDVSVVYCDLDNFKAYNDRYGFGEGDRVIQFSGDVLKRALDMQKLNFKFVGHIGGDDFIFIVPRKDCESISHEIGSIFDEEIKAYYNQEDLDRNGIIAKGRNGEEQFFPLMCLSMGGVHIKEYNFTHPLQLTSVCAEVKKMAKKESGSVLVTERRRD